MKTSGNEEIIKTKNKILVICFNIYKNQSVWLFIFRGNHIGRENHTKKPMRYALERGDRNTSKAQISYIKYLKLIAKYIKGQLNILPTLVSLVMEKTMYD